MTADSRDVIRSLPFQGFRILDFTQALAGPTATMFLSTLGAECIRIGRVQQRRASRGRTQLEEINVNKLSIMLDLKQPEAIEIVRKLASVSDAVVDNFRPGVMDRLGIGYEALSSVNPRIVSLSISAQGATGPAKGDGGYAGVFSAMAGFSELMGYPDGPPVELRAQSDLIAGTMAAQVLMAALVNQRKTGQGQFIDMSNTEMFSVFIGEVLMDYFINHRTQTRQGNEHIAWTPNECYRCAGEDRWISITVTNDGEWQALAGYVGGTQLQDDERFADGFLRWRNREALNAILCQWSADKSDMVLMEALQDLGIPAVPVMHPYDLMEDPHLNDRERWQVLDRADGSPYFMGSMLPWVFSKSPALSYAIGSDAGADTDDLLRGMLELSDSQIEDLRQRQVIG